jgi:hypothetical protein
MPYVGDGNGRQRRPARDAYMFFLRNFPTTHLGDVRLITLNENETKSSQRKSLLLRALSYLGLETPSARVRIQLDDWNVYDHCFDGSNPFDIPSETSKLKIDDFMGQGWELEYLLSALELAATDGNSRIHPGQYSDFSMLKDYLEETDLQVALD